VLARVAGQSRMWDVDRVVANIGFTPDALIPSELPPGPLPDPRSGPAVSTSPGANFYLLGSKGCGRNADFLLEDGFAEVRAAFARIMGNPEVDRDRNS
jgi:hypothetical protein